MYMWTLRPKIFFSWLSVIWLFFSNQPLRILRRWLSHKTFKLIKLYATTYNGVGFLYILKRNNFRAATFTLQKIKVHSIFDLLVIIAWIVPNYAMYSKINLWKKKIIIICKIKNVLAPTSCSKLESYTSGWPKVIHPKYSTHWLSTVAHTIDCVCSKILSHGLNHGLLVSLFKFFGWKEILN